MPNQDPSMATTTPVLDGPQWRALLEARWQARLTELTELSLAYHAAAEAIVDAWVDESAQQEAQLRLRRDGRCEQCESAIPAGLLVLIPETRYCPRCDAEPGGPW
jgi:hypothetical protein